MYLDHIQFGGGGARIFFKINPYFLQCLAFFAFGVKASGYKRGSHCGEPMEHLSSPQRVWTRKNESGERPARPQH